MLFTKTVCSAGSLVYIVPTGLLVTLRYDVQGVLSKVYQGINVKEDLGEDFLKCIVRMGLVPNSIKLHGGTTDVWGVFYSNEFKATDGILPDCEFTRIVKDIESGSPKYRFYVGNVESGAMQITPSSMQSWTKMVGFETLPCWAVPIDASDSVLKTYITNNIQIHFEYPLLSGFMIFEGQSKCRYYPIELHTATVVDKPERFTDHDGYIKYGFTCGDNKTISIDYPDAVRFNIQKGSQIILDGESVIWSDTKSAEDRLPSRTVCTYCNKILDVPSDGPMMCSDPFCISRLYPRIHRFCKITGIDELTVEEFDVALEKQEIQILPDLLLLPKYKDTKITKHLSEVLLACIDGDVGLNRDWMVKLCNKCNNSYATVKYYLEGPRRIETDLDMQVPIRFNKWLAEPRNLIELDTIVNSEQINLIEGGKIVKFEGAPILRDKRIMITGTFMHGNTDDIIAILNSYSANVVTEYDKKVQCIVVGDIKENIDGLAIQMAREFDIPMFDESQFFARYQIDEDLEKFLR